MAAKKTTATAKFSDLVLAELNKSDDAKQTEKVIETIEDYKIDINGQISAYTTVELPRIKNSITKEERKLEKLVVEAEKSYLNILGGDFTAYVSRINTAQENVYEQERVIARLKSDSADINKQIDTYKIIKAKLES